MRTFSLRLTLFLLAAGTLAACNSSSEQQHTSLLDTVSLSNKKYALAYQDGNKIVATSIDTLNQVSFGGAAQPAISPDGNKLAYTVTDSTGGKSIWVADMENKSQGKPNISSKHYEGASWSPDGQFIAFNILTPGGLHKIGLIKADFTDFNILDEKSATHYANPSWTADGKKIIASDAHFLYSLNLADKTIAAVKLSDLAPGFKWGDVQQFFYSKDQETLIFFNGNENIKSEPVTEAIYALNVKTKALKQISTPELAANSLFVTADDRIFFGAGSKLQSKTGPSKIYECDLNGKVKLLVEKGNYPTASLK